MRSGERSPDERDEVLARLTMLPAFGAVVFRMMAISGGLAPLWWSHAGDRAAIAVAILGFFGANAVVLFRIWGGIVHAKTIPQSMLVLDALLMVGFAVAVQQIAGTAAAGQVVGTPVLCGILGLWTAVRGPRAGAVVTLAGLVLLSLVGWLATATNPWWMNVLAVLTCYASAVAVVAAFRYILRDGVRATGEIERRHAHRVMHDTAVQTLEAIALTATTRRDGDALMRTIARMARGEVARLRDEFRDQAPPSDLGLRASLAETVEIARARGLTVVVSIRDDSAARLQGPGVAACVAAVGEALSNVLRHSGTDVAVVELSTTAERIQVSVADAGSGFDTETVPDGFGMRESIRGRLAAVGGGAEVRSSPSTGTEVVLWVPRRMADARRVQSTIRPTTSGRPPSATPLRAAAAARPRHDVPLPRRTSDEMTPQA